MFLLNVANRLNQIIVRVHPKDKSCGIGVRMRDLARQTEYIENCSETFKESFSELWKDCQRDNCEHKKRNIENCESKVAYQLSGRKFEKCTYESWGYIWNKTIFKANIDDIKDLIYFVKLNDIK